MAFAACNRVGVAFALLGALATMALGPTSADAAATTPVVTVAGRLVQCAGQTGPAVAAVLRADKRLVPVEAAAVTRLKPGSELSLNVVVPPRVRAVATAHSLLTLRGVNQGTTPTPLDTRDLAATSDGIPEPATSDLAIIGGIVAGAAHYAVPLLLSSLGSIT